MKAVAYVRSSPREHQTGLGPEAQERAIREWAAREGLAVSAVYVDMDVSGADPVGERPGLLSAIEALSSGDVLVVAKRDRLARDVMTAALIERLAERKASKVASADGVGNGDGPEAQLIRGILDLFAQYERAVTRARTKAALASKKARGEYVGGSRFGYRVDGATLVRDEAEAEVLRLARSWRAKGWSYKKIADALTEKGIQTKRGGRWQASTVKGILDREAA